MIASCAMKSLGWAWWRRTRCSGALRGNHETPLSGTTRSKERSSERITNPKGNAASRRFLAAGLAVATAAVLLAMPSVGWAWTDNEDVRVKVTDLDVLDHDTGEIELEWEITAESETAALYRSGYCLRARSDDDEAWSEESCSDGAATTNATITVGKPNYCRSRGVDQNTQGEVRIKYSGFPSGPFQTHNAVLYSPWSSTYSETVTWRCSNSPGNEIRRDY